ncbi:MAG: glycosyltransferase family 2 protein [Candidatus Paracaedibacteraceae bacterium]|nr:glycosyltransferase family 2 protein [Candidatus Paracaedibacteraceae bacterium]
MKNKLKALMIVDQLPIIQTKNEEGHYSFLLMKSLKDRGYDVHILALTPLDKCSTQDLNFYYDDITFETLPTWAGPVFSRDVPNLSKSFEIYRFLRSKKYDAIFYEEKNGTGFYLTEAKRQGYAFHDTVLIGSLLNPTEDLWDFNNENIFDISNYLTADIEQRSIESSNMMITLSKTLHDCMAHKGWNYPERKYILPPLHANLTQKEKELKRGIKELVFIGPLDIVNGFDILEKTIEIAFKKRPDLFKSLKITLLSGDLERSSSSRSLQRTFKRSCKEKSISVLQHIDMSFFEIMDYLQNPLCLPIFCSRKKSINFTQMASLEIGNHFIAQRNGAFEEYVNQATFDNAMTSPLNPLPLALKLISVLDGEINLNVGPRLSKDDVQNLWSTFFNDLETSIFQNQKTNKLEESQNNDIKTSFVSVCIPHHNRPDQLMDALKSLDAQDYKDFEVLVMDDGSPEEAKQKLKEIVEPYMHQRGWQLFYQENQYMNAARNNLVLHAKGDWLLFMDDDDLAVPDEVSRFVKIATKTNADIVGTNCFLAYKEKHKVDEIALTLGKALVASITGSNFISNTNIFIKKDKFIEVGMWYDHYGFSHTDQYLPLKALSMGMKIEISVEPTFIYNLTGTGHISQKDQKNLAFQYRMVSHAYGLMLPKELRNLPYFAYSLNAVQLWSVGGRLVLKAFVILVLKKLGLFNTLNKIRKRII